MSHCLMQLQGNTQPCFGANLLSGVENVENIAILDELFIRLTGTAFAGMHLLYSTITCSRLRRWQLGRTR